MCEENLLSVTSQSWDPTPTLGLSIQQRVVPVALSQSCCFTDRGWLPSSWEPRQKRLHTSMASDTCCHLARARSRCCSSYVVGDDVLRIDHVDYVEGRLFITWQLRIVRQVEKVCAHDMHVGHGTWASALRPACNLGSRKEAGEMHSRGSAVNLHVCSA